MNSTLMPGNTPIEELPVFGQGGPDPLFFRGDFHPGQL